MKGPARLLLVASAVGGALWLLRASPRDLTLVYTFDGVPATLLEVEVLRGGTPLRRAEFRLPGGGRPVRHELRLPDGEYLLRARLFGDAAPARVRERPLSVAESGTVVLPLGD